MANTKSAAKRARQTPTRTLRNRRVLTGLKNAQKTLRANLSGTDPVAARSAYQAYVSELDRAAKRGIIHQNAADRRKGNLARALAAVGAAS